MSAGRIIAKTKTGSFVGKITEHGAAVWGNIPFARFNGRWKPALEPEPSDETYDAFELGPAFPQACLMKDARPAMPSPIADKTHPYSEEYGFNLSVSTGADGKRGKPVFFYIHGGANLFGGGYDPAIRPPHFADRNPDIVYVLPQYRLSMLSGLCLEEYDSTGEYKMSGDLATQDLVLALKWVYENIEAFSGDPENITIAGESAGSLNCYILTTVPDSWKYWKKAILQSGTPFIGVGDTVEQAKKNTRELFELLGVSSIEEAAALPVEELFRNEADIHARIVQDGIVLPVNMLENIMSGDPKRVVSGKTIVAGNLSGEFLPDRAMAPTEQDVLSFVKNDVLRQFNHMEPQYNEFWARAYLPDVPLEEAKAYLYGMSPEDYERIKAAYIEHYPERSELDAVCDLMNDVSMTHGMQTLACALAKNNRVYNYIFDWTPENDVRYRPAHADEVPIMGMALEGGRFTRGQYTPEIVDLVQELWTGFMKTGVFAPAALTAQEYGDVSRQTLIIDTPPRYESRYHEKDFDAVKESYLSR